MRTYACTVRNVYVYVHMYIQLQMHTYVRMYVRMWNCIRIYVELYMYACRDICTFHQGSDITHVHNNYYYNKEGTYIYNFAYTMVIILVFLSNDNFAYTYVYTNVHIRTDVCMYVRIHSLHRHCGSFVWRELLLQ